MTRSDNLNYEAIARALEGINSGSSPRADMERRRAQAPTQGRGSRRRGSGRSTTLATVAYDRKAKRKKKKSEDDGFDLGDVGSVVMDALKVADVPRSAVQSTISDIATSLGEGDYGEAVLNSALALPSLVPKAAVGVADAVGVEGTKGASEALYANNRAARDLREHTGAGTYLERGLREAGLQDTWLNNQWVKRGIGFTGDVATDPLTYLGGAGVVRGGAEAGAKQILKEGAPRLATKFAEEAGVSQADNIAMKAIREEATRQAEEAAAKVVKGRGVSALSAEEMATFFGDKGGLKLRVPGTGRVAGKAFGGSGVAKEVTLLPKGATDPITAAGRAIKRGIGENKLTGNFMATKLKGANPELNQMLRSGNTEKIVKALKTDTILKTANARAEAGLRLLPDAVIDGEAVGANGLGDRAMDVYTKKLRKVAKKDPEGIIRAIETGDASAVEGGQAVKDFLHELYRSANANGVPLAERENYFPRWLTEEAKQARGARSDIGSATRKMTAENARANEKIVDAVEEATGEVIDVADEYRIRQVVEEWAAREMPDLPAGYYEKNINKLLPHYVEALTDRVKTQEIINRLSEEGIVVPAFLQKQGGTLSREAAEDVAKLLDEAEKARKAGDSAADVAKEAAAHTKLQKRLAAETEAEAQRAARQESEQAFFDMGGPEGAQTVSGAAVDVPPPDDPRWNDPEFVDSLIGGAIDKKGNAVVGDLEVADEAAAMAAEQERLAALDAAEAQGQVVNPQAEEAARLAAARETLPPEVMSAAERAVNATGKEREALLDELNGMLNAHGLTHDDAIAALAERNIDEGVVARGESPLAVGSGKTRAGKNKQDVLGGGTFNDAPTIASEEELFSRIQQMRGEGGNAFANLSEEEMAPYRKAFADAYERRDIEGGVKVKGGRTARAARVRKKAQAQLDASFHKLDDALETMGLPSRRVARGKRALNQVKGNSANALDSLKARSKGLFDDLTNPMDEAGANAIPEDLPSFKAEYDAVEQRVQQAEERVQALNGDSGNVADMSPELQQLYNSGDWEAFSRARGYTDEEIADFQRWLDLNGDGKNFDYTDVSPEAIHAQHFPEQAKRAAIRDEAVAKTLERRTPRSEQQAAEATPTTPGAKPRPARDIKSLRARARREAKRAGAALAKIDDPARRAEYIRNAEAKSGSIRHKAGNTFEIADDSALQDADMYAARKAAAAGKTTPDLPPVAEGRTRLFNGERTGDQAGTIIDPNTEFPDHSQWTTDYADAAGYGDKVSYIDVPTEQLGSDMLPKLEDSYNISSGETGPSATHYGVPRDAADRLKQDVPAAREDLQAGINGPDYNREATHQAQYDLDAQASFEHVKKEVAAANDTLETRRLAIEGAMDAGAPDEVIAKAIANLTEDVAKVAARAQEGIAPLRHASAQSGGHVMEPASEVARDAATDNALGALYRSKRTPKAQAIADEATGVYDREAQAVAQYERDAQAGIDSGAGQGYPSDGSPQIGEQQAMQAGELPDNYFGPFTSEPGYNREQAATDQFFSDAEAGIASGGGTGFPPGGPGGPETPAAGMGGPQGPRHPSEVAAANTAANMDRRGFEAGLADAKAKLEQAQARGWDTTWHEKRLAIYEQAKSVTDEHQLRALQFQADSLDAAEQADQLYRSAKDLERTAERLSTPRAQWQLRNEVGKQLAQLRIDPSLAAPNDVAEILNRVSHVTTAEGTRKFLHYYDQALNYVKAWQLASPGFHMRNFMGGMFNNYLAGVDLNSYSRFVRDRNAFYNGTLSEEKAAIMRELLPHVGSAQYSAFEVGGLETASTFSKVNPLSKNFAWLTGNRKVGGKVEEILRGSLGYDRLLKGRTIDEAVDDIIKYHFDYQDLSKFERGTIKRVIPFYTWTRHNLPLQMEMYLKQPGKYARYWQAKEEIEMGQSPEGVVPSYFLNEGFGIHTPFKLGGGDVYLTPDLPFTTSVQQALPDLSGVNPSSPGTYASALDGYASMMTPIIKTPIERSMNRQFFKGIPFQDKKFEAPTLWKKTPGLEPALRAAGIIDDKGMVTDRDAYTVEQYLPMLGRLRRLGGGSKKDNERQLTSWMSFLGVPVKTNTKYEQQLERYRRKFDKGGSTPNPYAQRKY